ncbi:LOW QUALITY PROTEIN: fucose mutarotase [Tautogolabrus adspersus]
MVVLKGIPSILSPELLYALSKMGHGDELVLADANFPASSICACGPKEIRADGLGIPQLLEAVLRLLPLDTYVPSAAAVMDLVDSDKERGLAVPVWETYKLLLKRAEPISVTQNTFKFLLTFDTLLVDFCLHTDIYEVMERFAFYERAKKAYAVVATGETALYGNLILKKGVIPAELLE